METYHAVMRRLLRAEPLDRALAARWMGELMDGSETGVRAAAVLSALAAKGETVDELVGFAQAMRARATPVRAEGPLVDTCGTGGSGLPTGNTSTLSAFVLAGAGVRVAKHGNRSASGRCGSSDVLERLGVAIALDSAQAEALLEELGFAMLFAPLHHPAMRHVAPVRKDLGFRTVFNLLGPLCNPAGARRQVLGVSEAGHGPRLAAALLELGAERALIVHGEDGGDEVSLSGATRAWWIEDGAVEEQTLRPADAGLEEVAPEALTGGDPDVNARLFEAVLDDGEAALPATRHVLLNAAAGLRVAGRARTLAEGYRRASESHGAGATREAFDAYRGATRRLAEDA